MTSQREVAAHTLVVLLESGLMRRDPQSVARAARELGLYVDEVRAAWRHHRPGWRPGDDPVEALADPQPVAANPGKPERRKVRVTPDGVVVRRCVRCRVDKPADAEHFYVKNKVTGALRSLCRDCSVLYQRERYLTRRALAQLDAAGLRFVAGDIDARLECAGCGEPIGLGADAVAFAEVWHADCHADCAAGLPPALPPLAHAIIEAD